LRDFVKQGASLRQPGFAKIIRKTLAERIDAIGENLIG
jgi:hypothetical protein